MRWLLAAALTVTLFACPSTPGAQGPEGPAGMNGAQGPKGDTGAAGPKGDTGESGAQGAEGPQGVQGPAGAVLVLDGGVVVGPPGSPVLVTSIAPGGATCPSGGVRITQLSDGGISNVCNGAAGVQGAPGPQGIAGPQGATGSTGATGPQGAVGGAGPQGIQGPAGPQGPAGAVLYLDGGIVFGSGSDSPSRPTLAGFTSTLYTGALGSRLLANQACGNEFPGAHLCNDTEFRLSRPFISLNAAGAFLDYGGNNGFDPSPTVPCNGFTVTSGSQAVIALPTGGTTTNSTSVPNCGSSIPLACCRGPKVKLRGFTSTLYTGALGSRLLANQGCHAQFPGSHLCNDTEFRLSRPGITLPAAGAFLDYGGNNGIDPSPTVPCNGFTVTSGSQAVIALPNGGTTTNSASVPNCGSSIPLACCD